MKVRIILVVGAIYSGAAVADWTLISTTAGASKYSTYIDLESVRSVGSYLRVWTLSDYETESTLRNGTKYRSVRSLVEYDCPNDQSRTLAISYSEGTMGGGSVVHSDMDISKPSPWQAHIPGSNGQLWANISCNLPKLTQRSKLWTSIGRQGSISVSVDKTSLQRTGDIAKIKVLFDFDNQIPENTSSGLSYSSSTYIAEFDCTQASFREILSNSFTKQRAEGRITSILSTPDAPFQAFTPGNIVEIPFKFVCPPRTVSGI